MYTKVKLVLSYDGTNYYGFQIQKQLPTIELELIKAVKKMTNQDVKIYASGRTDKGVHALRQVVHFETPLNINPKAYINGLNSYLPSDIRVIESQNESETFHSRFSAKKKIYQYHIMNDYNLFYKNYKGYYPKLNIDKMISASKLLIGKHNFKGFCSSDVNPLKDFVRQIYSIDVILSKDNLVIFEFGGNGFLRYQIRKMMGTLIQIGLEKVDESIITKILQSQDPKLSNNVAQACGLYLVDVIY